MLAQTTPAYPAPATLSNATLAQATPAAPLPAVGELLLKPPPAARDFTIFRRTAIEGTPTRDVAWQFKISQTRVCQIVKRVRAWLWEVLPNLTGQPATESQLQMARALAADRLEHLYQEALQAWRSSQGLREKTCCVADGPLTVTTHSTNRDPRYLTAAGRIALFQARLGLPSGILAEAQAELPDDNIPEPHPFQDQEPPADPATQAPAEEKPPQEECSTSPKSPLKIDQTETNPTDATTSHTTTYEQTPSFTDRPGSDFSPPTLAPCTSNEKSPVLDIRLTPETIACNLQPPSAPFAIRDPLPSRAPA